MAAGRHVNQVASGQRDRRGQPRSLGAHRFLGDLDDDLLVAMQLLLDRKTAALLVYARPPLVRLAATTTPAPAAPAFGARRPRLARDGGHGRLLGLALSGCRRGLVIEIAPVTFYFIDLFYALLYVSPLYVLLRGLPRALPHIRSLGLPLVLLIVLSVVF